MATARIAAVPPRVVRRLERAATHRTAVTASGPTTIHMDQGVRTGERLNEYGGRSGVQDGEEGITER